MMAICPDLDTLHSHVTLDWDTENEPHSTMYEVSKAKCIHWRVSASGKHKHILYVLLGHLQYSSYSCSELSYTMTHTVSRMIGNVGALRGMLDSLAGSC